MARSINRLCYREKAVEARASIRDETDPIEARRQEKYKAHGITVKEATVGCLKAREAELKHRGPARRWLSPLQLHVIPKIGTIPIEDVDQYVLRHILEPIWHTKTDTARKIVSRINLTLKHTTALGLNVDLLTTMKARELLGKQNT